MTVHVFKASFTKGEITPLAHARQDVELYQQAAETILNWCVTKYGGVFRRSGTRFLGRTKFPDQIARFIPFIFNSTGQAYQLEFGDGYIRFWIDYGQILDGSEVYEIESPYTEADLSLIQTSVDNDVMYISHPRHFPRALRRLAHDEWEIDNLDFIDGPYLPINDTATTITLSSAPSDGATRDVVFTYSGIDPFLTEADIGRFMRFQLNGFWWWSVITDVVDASNCEIIIHAVDARTNDDEGGTGTTPSSTDVTTRTWRMGAFSSGKPAPVRIFLTSGTSWTVPNDWNDDDNTVECIGGGSGGRNAFFEGGGGGAYARIANLDLTPAGSVAYVIGPGGAATVSGGDTYFNGANFAASSVGAKGGNGQAGGSAADCIGTSKFSGGDGAGSFSGFSGGGGGGGAAGPGGAGKNGGAGDDDGGGGGGGGAGGGVSTAGTSANVTTGVAGGKGPSNAPGGTAGGGAGSQGSGGGGGNASSTPGGAGGAGDEYSTHGAGGGGGGGGFGQNGGAGGNYGGGGGGAGEGGVGGVGRNGLIVITYTPNTAVLHDNPGYPGSVCLFDGRIVWGRTNANPRAVFASYVGLPNRYSPSNAQGTVTSSMGFMFDLVSGRSDPILWLRDGARIRIGTASAIRSLGSSDGTSAMGARNVSHRLEVPQGASAALPVEVGPSLAFLSRFGRGVHDAIFDYQTNSLVAPELSILSEHMFSEGGQDLAFQDVPDRLLWSYDSEGGLYCTTVERNEKVFAFTGHNVGGAVESISVIPTETRDELWLIVQREIDGSEVRYVEVLEKVFDYRRDVIEDAFFLDCGTTYEGAATKAVSGLDHLEGETVDALADGNWIEGLVVTAGVVTLPGTRTYTKITIGLPIDNKCTLLRAPNTTPDGKSLGRKKKASYVIVDVLSTGGLEIGTKDKRKELVKRRSPSTPLGSPIPLYSSSFFVTVDDEWKNEGQVEWTVRAPLPALIRALNIGIESEP